MNIFKVLSAGNSSLKEPSLSAILMHYLTPDESHGMESYFTQVFLKPFVSSYSSQFEEIKVMGKNEVLNLAKTSNFTVNTFIEAALDVSHTQSKNKKRYIDGVIEIIDTATRKVKFVFAIENKILASSASDKHQLKDEISGLIKNYEGDVQFGFIFLTNQYHDNNELVSELKDFLEKNNFSDKVSLLKYCWQISEQEDVSITYMLKKILLSDSVGDIEPLNDINKYVIKSLISFINTNFKSYEDERSEANKLLDNQMAVMTVDNFLIKHFKNNENRKQEFSKLLKCMELFSGLKCRTSKTRVTVFEGDNYKNLLFRINPNTPRAGNIQIHFTDLGNKHAQLSAEEINTLIETHIPSLKDHKLFKFLDKAFCFDFISFSEVEEHLPEIINFAKRIINKD